MKQLKLFILCTLLGICGNIAAQGAGTADDPIVVDDLAQVKNVEDVGKWFLIDLTGKQVSFVQGNEAFLEDATAGLVFTKGQMKSTVKTGDRITAGKIKLVCEKHGSSVWVNGNNNDIVVVEDIKTEAGISVAKEVTLDNIKSEDNFGRYIKVKGTVVANGTRYYFNDVSVAANRIQANYAPCKNEIAGLAGNGKLYYVYGVLLSDFFRGISFEEVYDLITADTDYYSLYLDFNAIKPEGVTLYTGKIDTENCKVIPEEVTLTDDVVPANTGFLLKADGAATYTFCQTDKAAMDITGNDLLGVSTTTSVSDVEQTGKVVLTFGVNVDGKLGFRKPQSGQVDANKVYIAVDAQQAAGAPKFYTIGEGEGTSGISNVTLGQDDTDAPTYNLAGQRVNGNARGLLIRNGKKFIRK